LECSEDVVIFSGRVQNQFKEQTFACLFSLVNPPDSVMCNQWPYGLDSLDALRDSLWCNLEVISPSLELLSGSGYVEFCRR
jgi:hypothetical protein